MLCPEVARAVAYFSNNRHYNSVTRVNMNCFELSQLSPNQLEDKKKTKNRKEGKYDNTSLLMKMISNLMMNVQQKSLNAKHMAANSSELKNEKFSQGIYNFGEIPENIYISLNKSCFQRKLVEYCGIFSGKCLEYIVNYADAVRAIPYAKKENTEVVYCLYVVTTKKKIQNYLQFLEERKVKFPVTVFISMKNFTFFVDEKTYLINFMLYHIFHECNQSFDLRQLGNKWRDMVALFYILGIINRHMLKISKQNSKKMNFNLAANSQSLGKSIENPAYQIFSENSIPTIMKVRQKTEVEVSGIFVNRSCGIVSPIGINDIKITQFF